MFFFRSLREKGLEEQTKNIKKKQRGLLLKWRQDHDELVRYVVGHVKLYLTFCI